MSRNAFRVLGLGVALVLVAGLVSADTDMATSVTGPATLTPGEVATFTMTYTNNGPATADSPIPELYIPSGIPANIIDLTQEQFDFIQESTVIFDDDGNVVSTNDTLGNVPFLFVEDNYCEDLYFQVNANNPPDFGPAAGLDAGVSGSFDVDIPFPQVVKLGKVVITEPANLAQEWFRYPANAVGDDGATLARASDLNFLARGSDCNAFEAGCVNLGDCFGDRLATTEPVEAEFVIVDDGGVEGDPLLSCGPPLNADELAGNIAVMRRGVCTFADKVLYVQQAGAIGVFMANDGRCGDFPGSADCVSGGMTAADLAPLLSTPVVQVSQADGEEIITAIQGGTTVRGMMGAVESDYAILDTNTWFLTATELDTDPSNDFTRNMFMIEEPGPSTFLSFVPAAALAAGLEGAFFQTDVDINNKGTTDATVTFGWLPRGADNGEFVTADPITLPAGHSLQIENVLAELFGAEPDVVGALVMITDSPDVIGMSRTYNVPAAKIAGTYGQALPAVPADDLIPTGERRRIIFMSENDDIRANVGCVNGLNNTMTINIELFDAAGTALETKTMTLGPWSNNQINRIFRTYAPADGYVDVWTDTADSSFYCYGSVLDNETSDPTTVLPQVPSADFTFIPAAALAAGLEGAFFQTDVDINNSGSVAATYNFVWLPRGQDNSNLTPLTSEDFTLAPGASARYSNVLEGVFGAAPDVVGALAVSADSTDVLTMSRTYNVPAGGAGTFGQALPGVPADMMIPSGEKRRIIFMNENDDTRANVGCQNGVNANITVNIELFDADGNSLETKFMGLQPWSNNQLNRIFRDHAPVQGYVDIWTNDPDATIYCYGSVLDNSTSDPTTVLPQ